MPVSINEEITAFVKYFRSSLSRLKVYELAPEDRFWKKTVIVSILDSLSVVAFPYSGVGHRERVVCLIESFSSWKNSRRLSVPHLHQFITKVSDTRFDSAREEVDRILGKFGPGEFVPLDNDPKVEDFVCVWPIGPKDKVPNFKLGLNSFTHASLFYYQRNNLVHEFRESGYGSEHVSGESEPFYQPKENISNSGCLSVSFELVYPLSFYFSLVESVIDRLEEYLIEGQINPYSCYSFGSSWIKELNN